jgi:hypothetical protein
MALTAPRLSALPRALKPAAAGDEVNGACHGNRGGVQPNDRAILAHPRVVMVFWGKYYDDHPDAMDYCENLCRDLVQGRFMNGLTQYGVGRGQVVAVARAQTPPAPATLSEADASAFMVEFAGAMPVTEAPVIDENALLYVVFLSPDTTPTISSGKDDFCGYHSWWLLHPESAFPDLFYAIIRTDAAQQDTGKTFAASLSACLSHEIAEAVTSRDGRGYHNGSCEIGDLCEDQGTVSYQGWDVEKFWSGWEATCVDGAAPVNIRTFLGVLGHHGGLAQLREPTFDLEYVASRMR